MHSCISIILVLHPSRFEVLSVLFPCFFGGPIFDTAPFLLLAHPDQLVLFFPEPFSLFPSFFPPSPRFSSKDFSPPLRLFSLPTVFNLQGRQSSPWENQFRLRWRHSVSGHHPPFRDPFPPGPLMSRPPSSELPELLNPSFF